MDKRANPRLPINLDVDISFNRIQLFSGTIEDFCLGGLFIIPNNDANFASYIMKSVKPGNIVNITFANPLDEVEKTYSIECKVARLKNDGIGATFTETNTDSLNVLHYLADIGYGISSETSSGEKKTRTATQQQAFSDIINQTSEMIEACTDDIIKTTLSVADDTLFEQASEAGSNTEQGDYFYAINELKKQRNKLIGEFQKETEHMLVVFKEGISHYIHEKKQKTATKSSELSLIDNTEFSHWILASAIINRLETKYDDNLFEIENRLDFIAIGKVNNKSNPIGPYALCHTFKDVLDKLRLPEAQTQVVYSIYETVLNKKLLAFYRELNNFLVDADVLPDLEKMLEVNKQQSSSDGVQDEEPQSEEPQEESPSPLGANTNRTHNPAAANVATSGNPNAGQLPGGQNQSHTQAEQTNSISVDHAAPSQGGMSGMMGVARELMSLGNTSPTAPQSSTHGASSPDGSPSANSQGGGAQYYSPNDLQEGFNSLSKEYPSISAMAEQGSSLSQNISSALNKMTPEGEAPRQLNTQQTEVIQIAEKLLTYFQADEHLQPQAKAWVSELELPMARASLTDESILSDSNHPAQQILNLIEAISESLTATSLENKQDTSNTIDNAVAQIKNEVDQNSDIFSDVLPEFENINNANIEIYNKNLQIVLAECESQQKLDRGREYIVNALNARVGGKNIPRIIIQLLDMGLTNILLGAYMHDGEESLALKRNLELLDNLLSKLTNKQAHADNKVVPAENILTSVSNILSVASKNKEKNKAITNTLTDYLAQDYEISQIDVKHLPKLSPASFDKQKDPYTSKPDELSNEEWEEYIDSASILKTDGAAKYKYTQKNGDILPLKLVWADKDFFHYTFVNPMGEKALDLSLGEVAYQLYKENIEPAHDLNSPVMERASFNFLDDLHKEFSEQASLDELTGLINRRSFERLLKLNTDEARKNKQTHVFAYLDIDKFNVINNTCGHSAGDILLKNISALMKDTFLRLGDNVFISRMGGNEFGVLITNCDVDSGTVHMEGLLDAFHDFRFNYENNNFSVTTSIGLVELNEITESVNHLFSSADAALISAKESGGNTVATYCSDDKETSRRKHLMEMVGQINKLFDAGLITLRCHKITPLKSRVHNKASYEVLIDVKDMDGNNISPEDFIVSAEQYNRIREIDTWVVNEVISWLETNYTEVKETISTLSINLSGGSINDRGFMDTIYDRLMKLTIPTDMICFEVTETLAINNLDKAAAFMSKVKETGCRFALDDFGSGSSSYTYLRKLPLDYIKIDGAFIRNITTNTHDYAVVKSINEIGHTMGLVTVAEYVEDEMTLQLLRDIGIDYAQGYVLEKPRALNSLLL